MNKIKILLILTYGLPALYAIHFFLDVFILDTPEYLWTEQIISKFDFVFNYVVEAGIFIGLILISLGLRNIVQTGIFHSSSLKYFNFGGLVFIIIVFADMFYVFWKITSLRNPDLWIQRIFIDFLLLILGLISCIFSDVLNKGYFIKNENDLTI